MTNSLWVTLHICERQFFLWPTACEWHCTFSGRQSSWCLFLWPTVCEWHHRTCCETVSSHLFLWPTVCEWHCTLCEMQSVSHLFQWPTASEWHCTFCENWYHTFFYYQQRVSDIAHFVKGSLITSFLMTNRMWVTSLDISWKELLHLFQSPTASEWQCMFCERQSHHIFFYDQFQLVSDIVHFVKHSPTTSFPMMNSMQVTLHTFWKAVSLHLFIWPIVGEWHCTFFLSQLFWWPTGSEWHSVHFVKGCLITSFPMTNRKWVAFHNLWKAVLSHDQQPVSNIHPHFVKGSLQIIYNQQSVSNICTFQLWNAGVSSHVFLWPTACEWHSTFPERQLYYILCYDEQSVSEIAHFVKGSLNSCTSFPMTNRMSAQFHIVWKAVLSHLFSSLTACEWHGACHANFHHIFSSDQQQVSDIANFWRGSVTTPFPMTNRKWVKLHFLWKTVSSHLFIQPTASERHCTFVKGSLIPSFLMTNSMWVTLHILWINLIKYVMWPIACEWYCTFCERQSHHIFSYHQQRVSDIAHLVKCSLITSFHMTTGCQWHHTFCEKHSQHICSYDQQQVSNIAHFVKGSLTSNLFQWPTVCEWHCTLCERQSHHIFSCDQQEVSDIAQFVNVSSHLFLWPTVCGWHCTICERQSHHIFSYDQQKVSDITHSVKGSLPSHLFLWPTVCEWHCTFCEKQSHHIFSYDQQQVNMVVVHFVKGSLITSFPITNSEWVTLHILWKAVSSHLFLSPTACEWHCTFCERQSHHIFSSDQQAVSHILWQTVSSHLFLWPTACEWHCTFYIWKVISSHLFLWLKGSEWHCTFCERQSHHIFSYDQQQASDIAHSMQKAVSSHLFLWPTACEWYCTFCQWQSHHIFAYDQQEVCDIAHFVKYSLTTSFPMTNSEWVTLHCEIQSHHISSHDQQSVSDIAHLV